MKASSQHFKLVSELFIVYGRSGGLLPTGSVLFLPTFKDLPPAGPGSISHFTMHLLSTARKDDTQR